MPPLATPEKYCLHCGARMVRRQRNDGRLEALSMFAQRKYCSIACSTIGRSESQMAHHDKRRSPGDPIDSLVTAIKRMNRTHDPLTMPDGSIRATFEGPAWWDVLHAVDRVQGRDVG